jgi:hypothetical protein
LIRTIQTVEKELQGAEGEGGKLLERVAQEVSGRGKKA